LQSDLVLIEQSLTVFFFNAENPMQLPFDIVDTSLFLIQTNFPSRTIKNKNAGSPSWKSFVSF